MGKGEREMTKIMNARIDDTFLGFLESGNAIFTFYLSLDYGSGNGQKVGGYVLGNSKESHIKGIDLIKKILMIADVDTWEELKGQPIKVVASHEMVYEIGSYLSDEWLNFEKFLKM